MSLWPFGKKNRTAPLEINRNFYLSALLGPGGRPPLLTWMNPDGSNGAVKGFAAPLNQDKSDDLLSMPIANGSFALATPDRKTIIQADFFDLSDVPEFKVPSDDLSRAMVDLVGERLERATRAVGLATLMFKGYSPDTYEAIRFLLDAAARIAELTGGIVADPLAETYRLPEGFKQPNPIDPRIDFRDVGTIRAVQEAGGVWLSTRGMAKFNLPEYEVYDVPAGQVGTRGEMLIVSAQEALLGSPIAIDARIKTPFGEITSQTGTKNRAHWGDRPTIELIPLII